MKKLFKEFKGFVSKGNILDLAIAVIIGGAFGKIVTSLVNDIIMPLISLIIGGKSFKDLKWVITPATVDKTEVALYYGNFIQSLIDFLIIAVCIFIMFKIITSMEKNISKLAKKIKDDGQQEQTKEQPITDIQLLTEIRDLLKGERKD